MKRGPLGSGDVGGAVARRPAEAGHGLVAHDANPAAVAVLTRLGASATERGQGGPLGLVQARTRPGPGTMRRRSTAYL